MIEAERRIREALADEALHDEGASVSDTLYAAHVFEEACTPENVAALLAEIDRLRQWEVVGREWLDKTDWMQNKDAPGRWLGKHRADALREEIDRLTRERDEARAERDAMAKDAERFRWLLDQELPDWMDVYHQHPDRVRAAIDAQIEQERSEQGEERA